MRLTRALPAKRNGTCQKILWASQVHLMSLLRLEYCFHITLVANHQYASRRRASIEPSSVSQSWGSRWRFPSRKPFQSSGLRKESDVLQVGIVAI